MSDSSRFYQIGLERGREGKSSPVGLFNFPNDEEERAAQRGWEAGQAAREQAEAVTEALEAHDEAQEDEDTSSSYDSSPSEPVFSFPSSVVSACRKRGYRVTDNDSERVVFERTVDGHSRQVYIYIYGKSLEFTVRSRFAYPTEADVPTALAVGALRRSAKSKSYYWCIERVNGNYTFDLMDNILVILFDDEMLEIMSRNMIKLCVKFEEDFHAA